MSEEKKILIVVESIDVEDSSGSKANVALIRNLHKEGFLIEVHHYTRKKIDLEGIPCFQIKEKRFNFLFLLSRIQRYIQNYLGILINKPLENHFGFSFTFFNDTRSIVSHLRKVSDFNPDLIITLSKGASFRPHYALLSLEEWHSRWLAYIHDPYPFQYYPLPYNWKEPGSPQKILFFEEVAQKCRWAAFPSLLLFEWMQSFFPAFENKSLVIPHQIEEFDYTGFQIPSYFDPQLFNIVHAGNLMKQRSPEGLLKGYRKFLRRDENRLDQTKLLFLGNSASHQDLFEKYRVDIPGLVISKKNIFYGQVRAIQENAAVNVIIESKAEISPFLPGKFPHCVQANKPILALGPEKSEVRRLLGNDYRFWSEVDDEERICELLEDLYIDWKNKALNSLNRYSYLPDYLSSGRLKREIDEVLRHD